MQVIARGLPGERAEGAEEVEVHGPPLPPELAAKLAPGSPASAPTKARYRFRDGLKHSSLLHALTFVGLVAVGIGPRAKETRLRREAVIVFDAPELVAETERIEVEPDRPIEAEEPPEPELKPVEEPPRTEPADDPIPELAEMADPLEALRDLPLDPIERIEPPVEEPLVAEVEPPAPEPLATAPEPEPAPPTVAVVVEGPRILDSPAPSYPRASYRLGHEGSVLLRIEIDARGRVVSVTVVESSGHERLDQAAVAAARGWRFSPGTEDGVPALGTLEHRLTFRIEG